MTVAGERVAARLRNLAFGSMVVQETVFFDRNRYTWCRGEGEARIGAGGGRGGHACFR